MNDEFNKSRAEDDEEDPLPEVEYPKGEFEPIKQPTPPYLYDAPPPSAFVQWAARLTAGIIIFMFMLTFVGALVGLVKVLFWILSI